MSNGGFRGFADFAKHTDFATSSGSTTAAATLAAAAKRKKQLTQTKQPSKESNDNNSTKKNNNPKQKQQLRPSPIYTGNDARLVVLFRKIGQKRDPITKVRALEDLTAAVYPPLLDDDTDAGGGVAGSEAFPRPEKIAALSHLLYLHETKLGYDNRSSVRAASYKALVAAKKHVPKAWGALFLGDDGNVDAVTVVGMAWGASKGDPAAEVARNASILVDELISADNGKKAKIKNGAESTKLSPGKKIQLGICRYSKMILGCKRPSSLQDAINPVSKSTVGGGSVVNANAGGGGKGKKNKKVKSNPQAAATTAAATSVSESEKEEMEERYERVILSVVCGLGWLLECSSESNTVAGNIAADYANVSSFPEASSVTRLLAGTSRASFRRGGYVLVGKMCQFASSLVLPTAICASADVGKEGDIGKDEHKPQLNVMALGGLIPQLLLSEKDPNNFVSLLEMILSYLAAFRNIAAGGSGGFGPWHKDAMEPVSFAKSLSKALRRGCCGAPAAAWGPTILPIVASLPVSPSDDNQTKKKEEKESQPLPLLVVSSLWEGRKSAAGMADALSIVSAVAECVTYLMLRRPKKQQDSSHSTNFSIISWRSCGRLFLETLSYYLLETSETSGHFGPVMSAVEELCGTLVRDLQKLDVASSSFSETSDDEEGRGIAVIKSWFWGEEGLQRTLSLENVTTDEQSSIVRKWNTFLIKLLSSSPLSSSQEQQPSSRLIPACKQLFHFIVKGDNNLATAEVVGRSTTKTCSADEGSLLLSTIRYCGVDTIFSTIQDAVEAAGEGGVGAASLSSVERFCVNDLLRWILVHASSAMSSSAIIKTDFEIFKLCLASLPSSTRQKKIWETVLRELIKSYCNYTTLAIGLGTLAGGNQERGDGGDGNNADTVRCEVLDAFAMETADRAVLEFQHSRDILQHLNDKEETPSSFTAVGNRRRGNLSLFLRTCVGMVRDRPAALCSGGVLVSASVIRHWIRLCCKRGSAVVVGAKRKKLEDNLILEDESGTNVLLETLLNLAASSSGSNMITRDETVKLVYESWLEGGRTWDECAVNFFNSTSHSRDNVEGKANATLREQVVSIASSTLCGDIQAEPPANDHALLELICQAWAKRAARLGDILCPSANSSLLDLVGLSNIELWNKATLYEGDGVDNVGNHASSEFLFLCLMYLLHSIDTEEHRRDLLFNSSRPGGAELLFVHIQSTCTSKSSAPHLESFPTRTARNSQLLESLGGRDGLLSSESLLEDCCMHNINLLSSLMKDEIMPGNGSSMMNQVLTSLSLLTSLLFPLEWPSKKHKTKGNEDSKSDDIVAADVKEGDSLWYEKGEERMRVKVTVVKIHRDDFPNLYFTIQLSDNGERQTVASRLKRYPKSTVVSSRELLPKDGCNNAAQRDRVGRCIVDKLVKPFLSDVCSDDKGVGATARVKHEVLAECMNIVISQCGLVSLGIGSVRYEIFQAVTLMERGLCDALSASELSLAKCVPLLRCLSLVMGYGIYTKPAQDNVSVLKMDPNGSIGKLLELYENPSWMQAQRSDPMEKFHTNVLMWLATTGSALNDGETFRRISAMMYSLSDIVLLDGSCNLAEDSLHLMNAISSLQYASDSCIDYSSVDNEDEKSVMSKLSGCFVNLNIGDIEGLWIETFSSLLQQNYHKSPAMLLPAANSLSNELCDCLADPVKRWCAFQLLRLFAQDSQPIQSGDDIMIPSETEQQLLEWKEIMDEEEGIELEEDVSVAASWLPERIMSLLQNIGNDSAFSHSEPDGQDRLMRNLLVWIASLEILDVAGNVDMRNRSHISSFIQKTNALGWIMTSALQEADLDIRRSENIFACLDMEDGMDDFSIQKIATLVLFRTVESLPTLVKTWYNDDCPRFLRQKLSAFVDNIVAPATLQRELVRIKDATTFGEMTVSGSCVSREVVATYQQDECALSVTIRMPSTFPLRNVEVDCQKTMGIAENRWRRWALQIMLMLNNQDGSVLDALLLWKQNVDKEFEGVEPCPVCYSVLCIKTHRMPDLECKTCHNRFHTSCLYKWFQSSGKSVCVICQQPWSGTKV